MEYRYEKDAIGEVKIPSDVYYGIETQRIINNFKIAPDVIRMPKELIHAFAYLKKAAAIVNFDLGLLSAEKSKLIASVCDEILSGELDDSFPPFVWQSGDGIHTNININEVIANRAHVLEGGKLTDKEKSIHPCDDVNLSQSANDLFSSAMNIAAYKVVNEITYPALVRLRNAFAQKSISFLSIIKSGRADAVDTYPLTLGQEFSGYVSQLEYASRYIKELLPRLSELSIGAADVGTGFGVPENYSKSVVKKIAELTNNPFVMAPNKFEAVASPNGIVEAHSVLKSGIVGLMKIANDIKMSGSGPRTGIGEISIVEKENLTGKNSEYNSFIACDFVTMMAAQVMGNDVAISVAGSMGRFELNVFKPLIIFNFLHSALLIGDSCNLFCEYINYVEANKERIKANLDRSLIFYKLLNDRLGASKAAVVLQKAKKDGLTMKEAVVELGYLTAEEYDVCVDIQKMIGRVNDLKKR